MSPYLLYVADLVAVAVLTFGVYLPRHHRRDLVIAFWGVNVGVLAVAAALATSTVGAGLGLGLFGVLSIIRLRSTELEQQEVAYYFSSLALGLLGGLGSTTAGTAVVTVALMALVVLAMFVVGHPRVMSRRRQQLVLLDTAFTDEALGPLLSIGSGRRRARAASGLSLSFGGRRCPRAEGVEFVVVDR